MLTQLRAIYGSMTPNRRIAVALLLAIVGGSLGYLFVHETAQPSEYLFGGEPLSARELDQVEAAIAQAGLSGHQREGSRIRVPGGQKSVYLAAVADARALPPNFHTLLENALNDGGPWESREAKRERLKIAKQQTLAEIVRAMSWVESAYVLYDEQQTSGLRPTTLATAVVSVMPRPGQALDGRRAKKLQELVAHSVVGMKAEDVKVVSLAAEEMIAGDGNLSTEMFDDPYYGRRIAFEQATRDKILHVVGYIPGVRVQVNAELDDLVEEMQRDVTPDARSVPVRKLDKDTQTEQTAQYPVPSATGPNAKAKSDDTEHNTSRKSTANSTETEYVVGQTERVVRRQGFMPKDVRATVAIPRDYVVGVWQRRNSVTPTGASSEPSDLEFPQVRDEVVGEVTNLVEPLLAQLAPSGEPYRAAADQHVKIEVIDTPPAPLVPERTLGEMALAWTGQWWATLATLMVAMIGLAILRSALKIPAQSDNELLRTKLAARREERNSRAIAPSHNGSPARSQSAIFESARPGDIPVSSETSHDQSRSIASPPRKTPATNSMLPRKTVEAVVNDLGNMSPQNLKTVLDTVDIDILALALVGAEEPLITRVSEELPKAAAKTFRRHLEQLGPTRLSDVEAAQRALADLVLRVRAESAPRPLQCAA